MHCLWRSILPRCLKSQRKLQFSFPYGYRAFCDSLGAFYFWLLHEVNPEYVKITVAAITVEHLACQEWLDDATAAHYRYTGQKQWSHAMTASTKLWAMSFLKPCREPMTCGVRLSILCTKADGSARVLARMVKVFPQSGPHPSDRTICSRAHKMATADKLDPAFAARPNTGICQSDPQSRFDECIGAKDRKRE